jgi:PAS domain S-box-containing protein
MEKPKSFDSALYESMANLMENMNQTSVCLLCFDLNGKIINCNNRGLRVLGINEKEELIQRKFVDFLQKESADSFNELLTDASAGARTNCLVKVIDAYQEKIPLELHAILVEKKEQDSYILATAENIDERIWSHETYLKKREKQIEFEQMDSIGEFAAGVSHEINNPLTIIKTQNSLLRHWLNTPKPKVDLEKLNQSFDMIDDTVERAKKIIESLSNFSKKSSSKELDPINVKEVIEETLLLCKSKLKANQIEFIIELDSGLCVLAKKIELSQVFLNLINNSFDAIKDDSSDKWIKVSARKQMDSVQILFSDSGQKIELEIAKKMMNPFFTTKEVGEGMGLGLSISSSIIKRFNGRIYYDTSSKQKQFVIELHQAKSH